MAVMQVKDGGEEEGTLTCMTAISFSVTTCARDTGCVSRNSAAEAERASIKYKMVEFMKERIGQEYEGHVSGMSEGSLFIELDENHIEWMTFLRDLEDDYYQFDRERYELQGHRTGRRLTLGDPVRIRVRRADLQKRLLEFEVICFRKPIR